MQSPPTGSGSFVVPNSQGGNGRRRYAADVVSETRNPEPKN